MHAPADRRAAVLYLGSIVTDAFVDDSAQIFSMSADGSHRVQLTSGSNSVDPAWSPNGK
jgi:Tol biopolymer transport system component